MESSKDDMLLESLLNVFQDLGKRGKPLPHEHTTLAGIAVQFNSGYIYDKQWVGKSIFLAVATGTKCISAAARNPDGFALHDCHGEILARRIVVRWLIDEIRNLYEGNKSYILCIDERSKSLSLLQGVTFHLIVTSPPCGDCAVLSDQSGGYKKKRHRTGAKIVIQPSKIPDASIVENYSITQLSGVVRRKPGRGAPTSSMSCSDKILKWNLLGFQGCLLKALIDNPIYFSDITIAYTKDDPADIGQLMESKAVKRALWERAFADSNSETFVGTSKVPPKLHVIIVSREKMNEHGLAQTETRSSSSGGSAMWWAKPSFEWKLIDADVFSQIPRGNKDHCEIIVGKSGYKMGSPKVIPNNDKQRVEIFCSRFSRAAIRRQVESLLGNKGKTLNSNLSYSDFKGLVSNEYVNAWKRLKRPPSIFSNWILKITD